MVSHQNKSTFNQTLNKNVRLQGAHALFSRSLLDKRPRHNQQLGPGSLLGLVGPRPSSLPRDPRVDRSRGGGPQQRHRHTAREHHPAPSDGP